MAIAHYFVLPYAETEEGTEILLAERQLIQRKIDGKSFDGKTGPWPRIPHWAGQYVLIGGSGQESEPSREAALDLFYEQTGVELTDAQMASYGLVEPAIPVVHKDKNYNSFWVLNVQLSGPGLQALATDIARNIDNKDVYDGVLRKVSVFVGEQASEKIGPIDPPADGWRTFLVENYFGGRQPGGFNTTIDILQSRITKRSVQDSGWFKTAINTIPQVPIAAEITGLKVEPITGPLHSVAAMQLGALGGDPLVVEESYSPGSFVRICAITEPDTATAHKLIEWEGGIVDETRPYDCRLVPLDQVTPKGHPILITATLGKTLTARISVGPSDIALNVASATNPRSNEWVAQYEAANTNPITITATTVPNNAIAQSYIEWTHGQVGASNAQRLVPVDQIAVGGVSTDVTASLPDGRSETVRCRVLAAITGLTVSAYGFQIAGQHWYTYVAANPATVVTVTTAPNTPAAWAQVQWINTLGVGRAANEQLVDRSAHGTVLISAGIADGNNLALDLDIKTPTDLNGLTLNVQDLTFAGGNAVLDDMNVSQPRQWVRGGANPPQTYARNTAASVAATLDVTSVPAANTHVDIRATGFFIQAHGGSTNLVWEHTNIPVNTAGMAQILFAQAPGSVPLPNEVNYQDTDAAGINRPLDIIWEMRTHGGGDWTQFDVTNHPFYITLGAPVGGARLYWTELKISCLAANGETTQAGVVDSVYRPFTAKLANGINNDMTRTSGGTLKYWFNCRVPNAPAPAQQNNTMLANPDGNGSCKAWAMMLIDMYRLHGINTGQLLEVKPDRTINVAAAGATGFQVENWTFDTPPPLNGMGWSHDENVNCRWVNGAGQNEQNPLDGFSNHFIVRNTTTNQLYDPSYGSPAQATQPLWEANAIAALYRNSLNPDTGFIRTAANAPATITVLSNAAFPPY